MLHAATLAMSEAQDPSIPHDTALCIYKARVNEAGDDTTGLLATQSGITADHVHKIWSRELCGEMNSCYDQLHNFQIKVWSDRCLIQPAGVGGGYVQRITIQGGVGREEEEWRRRRRRRRGEDSRV